MDVFSKNIAAIAKNQPDLAARLRQTAPASEAKVATSRRGHPSLNVGQFHLTSTVDPVSEGLNLAAGLDDGPVAALGFALGYHLEPLAGKRPLLVWEPNIRLLRFVLSARDFSAWLDKCELITDKQELQKLQDTSGWTAFIPRALERLYQAEALYLQRFLSNGREQRPARPQNPRILIIPPNLCGTLEPAYWCQQALEALGCQVEVIPVENVAPLYRLLRGSQGHQERQAKVQAPLMRFLGELAVLKAEDFSPDLVLAMAQAPLDRRAINDLKKLGAKTAFWFVEDFRQMRYFTEIAASYDYFFHIQGQEIISLLDGLGANHCFLPVAAHPPCHHPLGLSPQQKKTLGAPVGFMGAAYPNRVKILASLLERGLPLKIWGVDWPTHGVLGAALQENRYISSREIVRIYNACPIILNLHSSPQAQTPIGNVDFINPRTFEIGACNGFQLVDRAPGLEYFFAEGTEIATFSSEDELLEKAAFYLKHPALRERMAAAAREKVLSRHTYYHRMEKLLDHCLGPLAQSALLSPDDPLTWLLKQADLSGHNSQGGK
jgi:spore maturation protein CgeB